MRAFQFTRGVFLGFWVHSELTFRWLVGPLLWDTETGLSSEVVGAGQVREGASFPPTSDLVKSGHYEYVGH